MQSSEHANWIMTIVPSNENSLLIKGCFRLSGDLAPKQVPWEFLSGQADSGIC